MRNSFKGGLYLNAALIALATMGGYGTAFAQVVAANADVDADVDDIVVTANKREQNLNDVGATVTAFGGEALKERGISSLEDIASIVPGLTYSTSTTNTPIFTLRGIGFQESSLGVYPAVSVYIDQAPLPFPILAAHTAFDLERVEVLKGPQGTLFGQNSTGGAINYIAAKPTDTWQVGGDIDFGRFNTIEGNAFISGPLGDRAAIRVAVTGLNSDDWQKSITREDTNGHKSYVAGRVLLEVDPSDTIKLQFNANGWIDKSQPQAQQLISFNPQTQDSPNAALINRSKFAPDNARAADWSNSVIDLGTGVILAAAGSPPSFGPAAASGIGGYVQGTGRLASFDPFSDRRLWQLALRADFELGDLTLTSLTSYIDFDQKQRVDQDGNSLVTWDLRRADGYIRTFNQELRLANDSTAAFRWIVGVNFEKSTTFEDQLLTYFDTSNSKPSLNYIQESAVSNRQDIKNYAAFGNLEYDLNEQLTLKAGARYTNSTIDSSICSATTPTGRVNTLLGAGLNGTCFTFTAAFTNGPPITGKLKEDNISWRAGLDYKVNRDVLLYANVSRGYKAGSFPSLSVASYQGLLPVTQESVTAYEGGFKASLADRKVQINGAVFYYDYKDKQIRGKLVDTVFGALDALINIPKSRVFGAEADVTVRPLDGLTINAALTYLDTKITQNPSPERRFNIYGKLDNFVGDPLPFTPKLSGVVNADYRQEIKSGGSAFAGVTASARTKSDAVIGANRIPFPYSAASRTRPDLAGNVFNIKGYTTVDARIGYEAADGAWKVMLWGKNILNQYYWTSVIPSIDSQARYAGMPATYGVTLGFTIR
jgi:outer membrane receptor protein involved in Fe transport